MTYCTRNSGEVRYRTRNSYESLQNSSHAITRAVITTIAWIKFNVFCVDLEWHIFLLGHSIFILVKLLCEKEDVISFIFFKVESWTTDSLYILLCCNYCFILMLWLFFVCTAIINLQYIISQDNMQYSIRYICHPASLGYYTVHLRTHIIHLLHDSCMMVPSQAQLRILISTLI